jgi:hypothetical protein
MQVGDLDDFDPTRRETRWKLLHDADIAADL